MLINAKNYDSYSKNYGNRLKEKTPTSPFKAVHHHQTRDDHLEEEVVGQKRAGAVCVLLLFFLARAVASSSVCWRWKIKEHKVEVLQHRLAERRQLSLHQTLQAEKTQQLK